MLKIAICDDDLLFCNELEVLLYSIFNEYHIVSHIDIFYSGERLKNEVLKQQDYDLIFLDIELGDYLGSEIGDFIRNDLEWESVSIVYISNKSNYALSLFKTRPFDFIVKPITYDSLKKVISSYIKLYNKSNDTFEYKMGRNYYKIHLKNIVYFQSSNKSIIIHCLNDAITISMKLDEIEDSLDNQFLRIHQSYLINTNLIKDLFYDHVIMVNDEVLTISQSKRKEIRTLQMKRWRDKKNG